MEENSNDNLSKFKKILLSPTCLKSIHFFACQLSEILLNWKNTRWIFIMLGALYFIFCNSENKLMELMTLIALYFCIKLFYWATFKRVSNGMIITSVGGYRISQSVIDTSKYRILNTPNKGQRELFLALFISELEDGLFNEILPRNKTIIMNTHPTIVKATLQSQRINEHYTVYVPKRKKPKSFRYFLEFLPLMDQDTMLTFARNNPNGFYKHIFEKKELIRVEFKPKDGE